MAVKASDTPAKSVRAESVKANDLAIKALKPRASEYEIAVKEHRGLVVRVHPSGRKSFTLRYRQDGALKRVSLQAVSFAAARSEWDALMGGVREGGDPAEGAKQKKAAKQKVRLDQRAAPTIAELAVEFIEKYAKRQKRSWRADELMLQGVVVPKWGKVKAKDIERRDVIALIDEVAETAPVRANRVLAVVRKMFNWAVDKDRLKASPCVGVKAPAKETSRERVLSDDELRTFWNGLPASGLPPDTQLAVKLQLLTACRIGEIAGASWSEFDLVKGTWLVPGARAKNGRENLVPLSAAAVQLLEGMDKSGPYLFPRAGKKSAHLRTDVATHELGHGEFDIAERFTSHDLRRTAATNLSRLGTSRVVMDAILNHKDRTVGAVYDRHDYLREKTAALEKWSRHLAATIAGQTSIKVVPIRNSIRLEGA